MTLRSGQRLGPYVVIEPSGGGGMGEVFKARDTRLNREVALKVIALALSDRSEYRQRFAAEARAIAALNHPHICALYDAGHEAGHDYLVMEYLDGETLAERLTRGGLSLRQVIGYGIEIADALEYAHRRGIIHRDLKPSNVFLQHSGGAKLLDFGLATLRHAAARNDGVSGLATEPARITTEGSLVGTLHYLAPERLDGRDADARSDVFAYGAVLYEMATGRKAFDERSQARLIAAILSQEPAIDASAGVPTELQWILQNCLAKNPDERWQSMGDIARVLKALARGKGNAGGQAQESRRLSPGWLAAAGLLALLSVAAVAVVVRGPLTGRPAITGVSSPVSFDVLPASAGVMGLTESTVKSTQFAVSPDGQALVFVAGVGRDRQLWIRTLDNTEPKPVPGTSRAAYPFWAADSRSIGFFADGWLKKIVLPSGPPEPVCPAPNGRGGTWNRNGVIVFSPDTTTPLHRVSAAAGSESSPLLPRPATQNGHRWPQFLPDGNGLIYFVRSTEDHVQGIYTTTLANPNDPRRLRYSAANGLYSMGRLLYVVDGSLMAQDFDAATKVLSGDGAPLEHRVGGSSNFYSAMSASDNGVLATWSGDSLSELVWFNRNGDRLKTVGEPAGYVDFRLSPDGQRLAVAKVDSGSNTSDLFVVNLASDAREGLTSSPANDATPVWSPDGERIVFRSNRRTLHDLFERPSHSSGQDSVLFPAPGAGMYPTDWSADGSILYHLRQSTGYDIWALNVQSRTPTLVVDTSADDVQGQFDPKGRLAYASTSSDRLNVYVRDAPPGGRVLPVSDREAYDPRWRGDGKELFYLTDEGNLMAVEIGASPLTLGARRKLFEPKVPVASSPYPSNYVVTRDGQRFLVKMPLRRQESLPITVTLNWASRLAGDR